MAFQSRLQIATGAADDQPFFDTGDPDCPHFCLFDNLEVLHPSKLEEYKRRVAPIVEQYGGRYVVLGGQVDVVEGNWRPRFPVMLELPSLEHAHRWYDSAEYKDLKALRLSAGRHSAVFLDGA